MTVLMTLLKRWGMRGAVLCLLGAGGLALFASWMTRLQWALAIAAAVLFVAAAALNWREGASLLGRRGMRHGASAALLVLMALGVAVLANAVSLRYNARWDLTENKRHSLSLQTVKLVRELAAPVEAIGFFRSDTPGKRTAEDLLKQYAQASGGKFTYRMEDPDRSPGLARRYGVESYGTLVMQSGDKSEKVLDADEDRLTNALVKVTRSGKPVIYVVKGHGERDLSSAERAGLSQAKEQMEKANYTVTELELVRQAKVPADAAVVIVPGPKTDLLPPELAALDAHLELGGRLLFMADPLQADGLVKYLARYGVALGNDLVVEPSPIGQLFGVGPEVPIVTGYERHPITKDMANVMTGFPVTRSVAPAKEGPSKGIMATALAKTSRDSWGETDLVGLKRGQPARRDPADTPGPVSVLTAVTIVPGPGTETEPKTPKAESKTDGDGARKPEGRLVVLGTSTFASNQGLGFQGNRDLFLNIVSWLSGQEGEIAIRPKDTRQNPIFLTSAQSRTVLWFSIVILPGAVMACGIWLVVRRRRIK
ncbi:MAG: GldG family protein [Candidatus Rokubacteria bacterium]|nr:GldG family protein [Candidatus Rokubacteria bacterium]